MARYNVFKIVQTQTAERNASLHHHMIDLALCPAALQHISKIEFSDLLFISCRWQKKKTTTHPFINAGVLKVVVCKTEYIFNKITNSKSLTIMRLVIKIGNFKIQLKKMRMQIFPRNSKL